MYYRDQFREELSITPTMVQNVLDPLAMEHPAAAAARPEKFVDTSFVDRIRASGYVEQVRR